MRKFKRGDQKFLLAPGGVMAHFRATWYHESTDQTGPISMDLWENAIIRSAQAPGMYMGNQFDKHSSESWKTSDVHLQCRQFHPYRP